METPAKHPEEGLSLYRPEYCERVIGAGEGRKIPWLRLRARLMTRPTLAYWVRSSQSFLQL